MNSGLIVESLAAVMVAGADVFSDWLSSVLMGIRRISSDVEAE